MSAAGRGAQLLLFGAVLLVPLALTAGITKPGASGQLVVFADALGFAAMSLLALQVFSSGRWATTTRHFGLRRVLGLHRQAGAAVLLLVLLHVAVLMADDRRRLALLDVATAPGRARAGMVALVGLVLLAVTSIWRAELGLKYAAWRALHLVLTAAVLAGAFVHVMWVDSYTSVPVVREAMLALVLAAAVALFWSRAVHPFEAAARPFAVRAVRRERGDALTVKLEAIDHDGLTFAPGQFARLRPAGAPYSLDDHPFTISSSAHVPTRPEFTIKGLGDYTGGLAERLRAGTEVLIDGPHGEAAAEAVHGRLLIAAGIGITPMLSVLRTHGDHPALLLYGSRRWADITFREELWQLERERPQLRVVHVLSRPEPGWRGETGRIDAALLRRHLPADVARWDALICGPPALVDCAERTLLARGMPRRQIQAEGFG